MNGYSFTKERFLMQNRNWEGLRRRMLLAENQSFTGKDILRMMVELDQKLSETPGELLKHVGVGERLQLLTALIDSLLKETRELSRDELSCYVEHIESVRESLRRVHEGKSIDNSSESNS